MIRIFRAEWRKLRRPSLLIGSLAAVGAVTAFVTAILFLLIDSATGNADRGQVITRDILALPQGITIGFSSAGTLLGLVAFCVFAAQTAQEYSYGTLRNLLVREPKRIKLLIGKYLSMSVFIAIAILISLIVTIIVAYLLASGAGVATSAWKSSEAYQEMANSYLNVLISSLGFGTIGMALGILLRSPISAISIGVGWLLVVENIIAAAWKAAINWLPGQLLGVISNGAENYSNALLKICAFLTFLVIAIALLFKRRDVAN